jgi:hypothetical protein
MAIMKQIRSKRSLCAISKIKLLLSNYEFRCYLYMVYKKANIQLCQQRTADTVDKVVQYVGRQVVANKESNFIKE